MEGFVVRDLINIVERAIHNSEISSSHDDTLMASRSGRSPSTDTIIPPKPKELHYEHFKKALECYRPVALRNIPLHTPEDINFDNIGGLARMKAALIETIQWPAKVTITCHVNVCTMLYHGYICVYHVQNIYCVCGSFQECKFCEFCRLYCS